MKKTATETSNHTVRDDRDQRIEALEARLSKLDPPKPAHIAEPFKVGDVVYSLQDAEGSYGLTVVGYKQLRETAGTGQTRESRWIIVTTPDDANPRLLPLAGVVPLEQCSAIKSERVVPLIGDEASRSYVEARRAARMPKPEPVPAPRQPKWMVVPD